MKHLKSLVVLAILSPAVCIAQDPDPPVPEDCELAAVVEPRGFFRETKSGSQHFQFTLVVVKVLSGRVSEGGEIKVTVGAPLTEGWKEAAHSLAGDAPLRGLVFLQAVVSPSKTHYVPVGKRSDFEAVDSSRIEAMKLALDERVRQAIFDLDSPDFSVRTRADKKLRELGLAAEELLRKAVEEGGSPEVVLRGRAILAKLPGRRRGGYWVIHQPDVNYPDDEILIWTTPSREMRAFKLAPGTRIRVLKKVDGSKFGNHHNMFKIKAPDGRTGWVPESWTRFVKVRSAGVRPLGRGEKITGEYVHDLVEAALDDWIPLYRKAGDKAGVRPLNEFFDVYSRKAGFESWAEFVTKAAESMGKEEWAKTVTRFSKTMTEKIQKLHKDMAEEGEKKEGK